MREIRWLRMSMSTWQFRPTNRCATVQVGSTDLCELVNLKGGHYLKEVSLLRKPVHLFIAVDVLYRRAFSGDIFPRQFKMAE